MIIKKKISSSSLGEDYGESLLFPLGMERTVRVFVSGFPANITEEDFANKFSTFGTVSAVYLPRGMLVFHPPDLVQKTERSRDSAF